MRLWDPAPARIWAKQEECRRSFSRQKRKSCASKTKSKCVQTGFVLPSAASPATAPLFLPKSPDDRLALSTRGALRKPAGSRAAQTHSGRVVSERLAQPRSLSSRRAGWSARISGPSRPSLEMGSTLSIIRSELLGGEGGDFLKAFLAQASHSSLLLPACFLYAPNTHTHT